MTNKKEKSVFKLACMFTDEVKSLRQTIITITGRVSTCKSPIAEKIRKACEKKGLVCEVNDHYLFNFDNKFQTKYEESLVKALSTGADVIVFVIGSGTAGEIEFRIEVQPAIPGVSMLMGLLFE
jgi:hypothetical protein